VLPAPDLGAFDMDGGNPVPSARVPQHGNGVDLTAQEIGVVTVEIGFSGLPR
jgi:hypothetical protein